MPAYTISIFVFLAVAIAVLAIGSPQALVVRRRLERYGTSDELTEFDRQLERPFMERFLAMIGERLMALVRRMAPDSVAEDIGLRLMRAGHPLGATVNSFLIAKTALVLLVPVGYGAYLLINARNQMSLMQLGLVGLLLVLALRMPDRWLNGKVEARQKAINRSLPDALDFIVVCVEAGLAFESAMGRVVERMHGPLSEEFRRTLGEISLGKRRRDALRDMATRSQAGDLVSFVAAIVQADQTGISIGDVLRIQADDLRLRRRQRAEKEGREAPLKMLLPLIFFIFPATFIAAVGPAALRVMDSMLKGQ